jgi:pimeloyl-ACP methyl ester carboxylesterase
MATFTFHGQRLAYTEHGEGPRVCVLLHSLLLSQRMHVPLARTLAGEGNRVVTMDLLGHGASDRPADMWRYSTAQFSDQVVALLDELELDEAVIAGTSLGANVALMTAAQSPDRVRGLLVEMPVLDNALVASAIAFSPLLVATTIGLPLARLASRAARLVPQGLAGTWGDVVLDYWRQDPKPSGAVLEGLFFGATAPHRSVRREIAAPTLVIGHRRDPVHPFSDAGMLVEELPNARLIEANTIFELRVAPHRLTGEIAEFLDSCWRPRRAEPDRRPARAR